MVDGKEDVDMDTTYLDEERQESRQLIEEDLLGDGSEEMAKATKNLVLRELVT
jgi:hypothetical protein